MAKRKVKRVKKKVSSSSTQTNTNGRSKADSPKVKLSTKDKKTMTALKEMANNVARTAKGGRAPNFDIPSRSLSNVKFNKSQKIVEMGGGKNRRELFNLSQAKSFMQTVLV